jgi:hypothetical protein
MAQDSRACHSLVLTYLALLQPVCCKKTITSRRARPNQVRFFLWSSHRVDIKHHSCFLASSSACLPPLLSPQPKTRWEVHDN